MRVFRGLSISLRDDRFGFFCHFMNRAVSEVDQFFRLAKREHAVGAVGIGVARISRSSRITAAQRRLHVAITLNRASPATITNGKEPAVPLIRWQPKLHVDV